MKRIAIMLVLGLYLLAGHIESHYTREAVVVRNNHGAIRFEDSSGNLWDFIDPESELTNGDRVHLKMYTNGTTETVYDDCIVGIN